MKDKIRVAVLRGGPSDEHEVSLVSGAGVLEALAKKDYPVLDIIIDRTGAWYRNLEPYNPSQLLLDADVCFLALHGTYGEDGQVQQQLEALGMAYTGSNAVASAKAIDKAATKELLKNAPCVFAPAVLLSKNCNTKDDLEVLKKYTAWVLKPNASGSSFGVLMVDTYKDVLTSTTKLLQEYDEVLVEARIHGREVTCGVIEGMFNETFTALPVVEIIPPSEADFFDTQVKYDGTTKEVCPADIKESLVSQVQNAAVYAHQALGLSQYSRSDFIIDTEDQIYFLETNTLPGLTAESLFPKEIIAAGSSYEDLIAHLVESATTRVHS